MGTITKYLVLIMLSAVSISLCQAKNYPYRWVYALNQLRDDNDVREIEQVVRTASEHGLNGIALTGSLDLLDLQRPDYFVRLGRVKQICDAHNIEIIPAIFSIGYASSLLAYDKNLAAGIFVKDAPFVVENGKAHLIYEPSARILNGGFEAFAGDRFLNYKFHDRPGEVSFVDTKIFKSGKASIRFENFGKYEYGHARLMQEVKVQPQRCYKLSCWVRTELLEPEGSFRMSILSTDGRNIAPWEPRVPATSPWRQVVMGFNSLNYDTVRVYAGVWGGKSGKFWVDDLEIEEVGLLNVLRRPGTPVTVKSETTGEVYEEGKDYAGIRDTKLNFRFDHEPPPIQILPGAKIRDGERLRVSYYHGMAINNGQVTACMSEPKVYEIRRNQAKLIHQQLSASKYLLNMDEIRAGGACEACKKRNMTMGQILGDCISKQTAILHEVNPSAEIFIWSDMLDPNHNAHGNYFLVEGDFTGSWKYVPQDLIIVCWYYQKRQESLKFFSSLGFKTLAGAYYDGDNLDNPKGWLSVLEQTPNACGIMYTTWEKKYSLLAPFGDLVAGKKN